MNILITIPDNNFRKMALKEKYIKLLKQIGNIIWNEKTEQYTREELAERLKTTNICITGWGTVRITREMVENTPLKFIGHIGGTVQGIISEDIFDTDVKVVSSNQAFGRTVAEYNLMMHLIAARKAYDYINLLKTDKNSWCSNEICVNGLNDKTIGIIGYGTISKELIKLLKPFDAEIKLFSSHCPKEEAEKMGFELVSLEELLKTSDYVNVQTSLTEKTYHMLDAKMLSMLKDGAIIVNAARGAIIDEQALIKELEMGRIFAALDVYEKEPLPSDSPLRTLTNVYAMPHMGGKTYENRENFGRIVVNEISRFVKGEVMEQQVSREQYSRMTTNNNKK